MALTRFHSRSFMHFYDFFYVEKEKISNQLFVNKSRADKQIAFTRFRRCRRFQICEGRTVKKMWWTFESFSSFRRIRKKILIYYLSKVFTFFTFCLNISIVKTFLLIWKRQPCPTLRKFIALLSDLLWPVLLSSCEHMFVVWRHIPDIPRKTTQKQVHN